LQVHEAGPPEAVEPVGQAVQVKAVGEPVWNVLFAQTQYCEPAAETALALMVAQLVQTEALGVTAE